MENSEQATTGVSTFDGMKLDTRNFRRVRVLIYTLNGIFIGSVFCNQQQRLLDALNKGFSVAKLKLSTDFVPIFNVDYLTPDQPTRHMDTAYIRKTSIFFVGEYDGETVTKLSQFYPMRPKKLIQTTINLPDLSLTGNMHSEKWEELQEALNRTDQFIPVTGVEFNPPLETGTDQLEFVAVNKDHIIYVGMN